VKGKEVGKGQRRMFIKRIMGHIGVFGEGSLRLAPALQSLYAATSVKQIRFQLQQQTTATTTITTTRTTTIDSTSIIIIIGNTSSSSCC